MTALLSRAPVGIRFGNYVFSPPAPLGRFSLPPRAEGLYVVMMPDPTWGPWHLQPLFFGEFGGQRQPWMSHTQQICCLKVAAGRSLYIAVCTVPRHRGWQVSQIKKELIEQYLPVSNLESIDAATEIAYRLDALEKRILEQDAVLKLALATIGQMVEPLPEPKRKIIGFQPRQGLRP
jgi:hypothetical protein